MDAFINSLLGGSLVSVLVGIFLYYQKERLAADIKHEFAVALSVFHSKRTWKETSLSDLLGPVYLQFDRTKRAMDRWRARNIYLEQQVIREGNQTIRDLLLKKGHLIPPDLLEHAGKLIEHYDRWLEEFERIRGGQTPDPNAEFVFAGPAGFPFPKEAELAFRNRFLKYQRELYDDPAVPDRSV